MSGLCLSRAAVGVGEAIAPSAAIDILSRIMPPTERSRAVSFVFSGAEWTLPHPALMLCQT